MSSTRSSLFSNSSIPRISSNSTGFWVSGLMSQSWRQKMVSKSASYIDHSLEQITLLNKSPAKNQNWVFYSRAYGIIEYLKGIIQFDGLSKGLLLIRGQASSQGVHQAMYMQYFDARLYQLMAKSAVQKRLLLQFDAG